MQYVTSHTLPRCHAKLRRSPGWSAAPRHRHLQDQIKHLSRAVQHVKARGSDGMTHGERLTGDACTTESARRCSVLSGRHAAPRMRRFAPCERLGLSAIKRCVLTTWVTTLCAWLTLSGWRQEMNRLQHKQETEINSRMAGLQAQTENATKVLSPHVVQGWCRGVTTGFCRVVQKARQLELRIASVDSQLAANKELSQRLDSVSCVCVPPRNQGCVLTNAACAMCLQVVHKMADKMAAYRVCRCARG